MRVVANTGAYGTHGLTVQMVTGLRGLSSYNSPLKRFDCKVAYTNIPVPGAYRGYGAPQALYALETHMEDIANELGMDAIEFRRLNWTNVGDPLDIAPQLGEGDQDASVMPLVTSSGLEEAVAQGTTCDRLGSAQRPRVEAAERQAKHPTRPRFRHGDARHGHPRSRHGWSEPQDQR